VLSVGPRFVWSPRPVENKDSIMKRSEDDDDGSDDDESRSVSLESVNERDFDEPRSRSSSRS
jgi:hypothetical protein